MVRGVVTFLAIAGLFCVLSGCSLTLREASEQQPMFETEAKRETESEESVSPAETERKIPETAAETQKVPETETEETMPPETVVNFENPPSEEAKKWIALYEAKGDPSSILLNGAEIEALNEKIRTECPTMHDMGEIPTEIPGSNVSSWIAAGKTPSYDCIDEDGNIILWEQLNAIEANKNLSAIPETVIPQTAVVTKRTNIRTVPTEVRFFNPTDAGRYFDRIQEAELILGTPVLVLHESEDGEFFFIQSYYYRGWVRADHVAFTEEEEYRAYLPEHLADGVTVIADTLSLSDGTRLDMGCVFPYVSSDSETFTVMLPRRDENGMLYTESAVLPKTDTYYGRLPYTYENFVTQAFKFLGTDYSWGGYNEGVDCSGFVCAVFRSFGIYLPRNTGEQKEYGGTVTALGGLGQGKIAETLGNILYPTAIHRPGHVMLFLGIENGVIHVIHAPTGGQQVSVMELWNTDNLISAVTVE